MHQAYIVARHGEQALRLANPRLRFCSLEDRLLPVYGTARSVRAGWHNPEEAVLPPTLPGTSRLLSAVQARQLLLIV